MSPHEAGPPEESPLLGEVVDRYLAGECTPDERAEIERRVEEYYGRPDILEKIKDAITAEALWERVAFRAGLPTRANPARVLPLSQRRSRTPFARELAAARPRSWRSLVVTTAIVALLGFGVAWWAVEADRASTAAQLAVPRVTATAAGQQATIILPDSTRVVLAPASVLAYTGEYGRGARDVSLVGQAYFEVTHDTAQPFRVHAGNTVLEDLGTEFNVRAYTNDAAMRVAVRHGRLAVRTPHDTTRLVLESGEAARVDTAHGAIRVRADTTLDFAWRTGTLAFRGAPVSTIVAELHRWFDIDIDVRDDTLRAQPLTIELRGVTPREAVRYLAAVLELRVEQHGRAFTLYPR